MGGPTGGAIIASGSSVFAPRPSHLFVLVVVLFCAGAGRLALDAQERAGAAGQEQAPAPQQTPETPIFRGGINFVRVDVIVNRNGEPVTDLSAADFEVLEDGRVQTIEQFTLVTVDGNPRPGDPPPKEIRSRNDEELIANRDDVRVFVIFFDDYHTRRSNSMSVREPLRRFVQDQLRPNDVVAVMYPLTPVSDLSFTRNHDSIVSAIEGFEGRKFDYTPVNLFEQRYAQYPTETVERIRNDVVMSALRGLSVRLGSLREGRKSVIFVSEGFTAMLPPQMRRADASAPANPFETTLTAQGQDSPRELTAEWFGQSDVYARLREVFDTANRYNTSIYSLDPRGLAPFEYGFDDIPGGPPPSFATDARALRMTQDTLRSLSEETDGRAIVNRNTLAAGLAQVIRDSSYYYLLGYTSSQTVNDGKFHEIRVRVRRPGVDIRARRGYWAATVEDAVRAATPSVEVVKPVQAALATIASSVQAGRYVRTWLGAERGENGKTRLTLVWEPLTLPPGDRREAAGRVSLLAASQAGDLVFRGRVPEQPVSGAAGGGGNTRAPHALVFETGPGNVELRLTVEGAAGGTLDQEIRTVAVPDFTGVQVALSTPRVYRARTIPELRTIASDADAIPSAGRDFARTERMFIRFTVYGPGTEEPNAVAALLNRSGQKMADVPVSAAQTRGATHEINLALSSIPAGEYLIEVKASGPSGEAQQLVPFRVTG
jgi:VWFA-related protein